MNELPSQSAAGAGLPAPLVPADCDLRDFAFMQFDVKRLLASETWILGTGDQRAAAIALWLESWHQVPAASLPDSDQMLAHLSQSKSWKKVREHALRGWVKCSDGRLYHPVVAEKALEAWIEKLLNSLSGTTGNAKRWGIEVNVDTVLLRIVEAASLLKAIAPQSKTLRKKQVVTIVIGSPCNGEPIAPRQGDESPPGTTEESPPESPGDRKGQGQGLTTEAKASDAAASSDPKSTIWKLGVQLLTAAGSQESQARIFLGKFAKDDESKLAEVIGYLAANPKVEPKAYIAAAMEPAKLKLAF